MNDRTTCFGCNHLKTFASEIGNFYFWCEEKKIVVGKIKQKQGLIVYPKPTKTNCKYQLVELYKKSKITQNK